MAIIKCKMCGGDIELSEDKTFGVCEYCGSTMTLPKVDGEQTAAAFNRGNHFRRIGEFDKALAVYEHIVELDDSNAEAHWCCALCRFGIEYVEDPDTHDYIPTCHRASFDSILEDVDYLAALEYSDGVTRKQYEKDGLKIAQVQKGVLAVSQKEDPFDVFLCYKETEETGERTRDSVLAQEIYYELTEQGRRVFFARVTLENKGGAEYEPYIFAALHSAKVMVVLGTKAEHFGGTWVKNEWSRFLAMMKQDRSKLLIPCYRDMDPYDLPDQLSPLQAYDMGKIGFLQDLTHGINKVLDAGKEKEEAPKETVVVQSEIGNLSALLQRGELALEDGEWQKADEFFEQALNLDADEPRAYLGKFLAQQKQPTLEKLAKSRVFGFSVKPGKQEACPENTEEIERIKKQYFVPMYFSPDDSLFAFDRTYPVSAARWNEKYREESALWNKNKLYLRALEFSGEEERKKLEQPRDEVLEVLRKRQEEACAAEDAAQKKVIEDYRAHLKKAEQEAAQKCEEAKAKQKKDQQDAELAREKQYEAACEKEKAAESDAQLKEAYEAFTKLQNYKDSMTHAQAIDEKLKAFREAAVEQMLQEQKKLRKRKLILIGSGIAAVLLALGIYLLATKVIIPNNQYSKAETLLEEGKYQEAINAFAKLEDYKDSPERKKEASKAKKYAEADALFQKGDYTEAFTAFQSIEAFRDSADRIKEIQYLKAEQLIEEKEYGKAYVAFVRLSDFKDAPERGKAVWQEAVSAADLLVKKGSYDDALKIYNGFSTGSLFYPGDDEALKEKVNEIKYLQAENELEAQSYVTAYDGFEKLKNYKDSEKRKREVWEKAVAYGDSLIAEEKFTEAMEFYARFTNRETAQEKKQDAQYARASSLAQAGDYRGALTDYQELGTYKDSLQQRDAMWEHVVQRRTIDADADLTIAIRGDGTVTGTGQDDSAFPFDRYSISDRWKDITEIAVGSVHVLGLQADGTVNSGGTRHDQGQWPLDNWKDIVTIDCSTTLSAGLKRDGTVILSGELGDIAYEDETVWSQIIDIAVSDSCAVGLRSDGTAISLTGDHQSKISSAVETWTDLVAIDVSYNHAVGLRSNGTVIAAGDNSNGQCDVSEWTDIVAISAGNGYTIGLKADGTVVATKFNDNIVTYYHDYGQYDVAGWTDIVAIDAGSRHTVGLKSDGTVVATGINNHSQCDVGGWTNIKLPN